MIIIINLECNNISSVKNILDKVLKNKVLIKISNKNDDLLEAKMLILPGVGTFEDRMKFIKKRELDKTIKYLVLEKKIPIIGICLGMQLLADKGYEFNEIDGLGLISGNVKKMLNDKDYPLPHIGWNEVKFCKNSKILNNLKEKSDFYFIHSYSLQDYNPDDILLKSNYNQEIIAAIEKDNIFGFQFHPEKSQIVGELLIKNILKKYSFI
jgi:imidazole glycerol-phosphate synthase subunit HisH